MTVRNPDLVRLARVFSYTQLNAAAPEGIMVSDIDGVMENDGHCLFFEFKCGECDRLKKGQRRVWDTLLAALNNNSMLVVCEHPDLRQQDVLDPMQSINTFWCQFYRDGAMRKTRRMAGSADALRWVVKAWNKAVEGNRSDLDALLVGFAES